MPTVVFDRTGFAVDLPEGGRVVDVCDDHPRAGVPFSCRGANCGTCRVEVREGLAHLEDPDPDERELLEYLRSGPAIRLACQIRIKPGGGRVRLYVTL
jgi:ferredoxin